MRKCRISVIRKTEYHDLMEKYENPIEHACNMSEGQVFIVYGIENLKDYAKVLGRVSFLLLMS